jgi:hypothetical protein
MPSRHVPRFSAHGDRFRRDPAHISERDSRLERVAASATTKLVKAPARDVLPAGD